MIALRIAILIGLVYLLLRWLWRRQKPPGQQEAFDRTVRCAQCGVVLPLAAAKARDGAHYCEDHAQQR